MPNSFGSNNTDGPDHVLRVNGPFFGLSVEYFTLENVGFFPRLLYTTYCVQYKFNQPKAS